MLAHQAAGFLGCRADVGQANDIGKGRDRVGLVRGLAFEDIEARPRDLARL